MYKRGRRGRRSTTWGRKNSRYTGLNHGKIVLTLYKGTCLNQRISVDILKQTRVIVTITATMEWRPRPLGRSSGRVMNGKCIHTPSPDQTLLTTQRKAVASTSPVLCLKEYPSGTLARGPWRERVFRECSGKAESMRVFMRGRTRVLDVGSTVSRGNGHASRGNGHYDAGSEAGTLQGHTLITSMVPVRV